MSLCGSGSHSNVLITICIVRRLYAETIQITSDTVICFQTPLGGLEPPAFRLTAEHASQLRHKGIYIMMLRTFECVTCIPVLYSVNEGFHKQMFNQKLCSGNHVGLTR
ncbi:hypothetical protein OUZ56_021744 [Daphnia magna]|uniref:Uncharacterized protein n=1 Tax=Daphnia magna TaxID=35525 RepID=A0ABR0AUC2_9CRUS|nr:hypothetical protein OUZ56_021742 [Daphnia magna]KAK4028728.1 hypothetical protein OUZ56_021744 [Daphnia magna]